ncbi:MAG: carbohydrate kinase family protein [Ardenticatenaceae bacterium]|nr:carbohydrate kinase family protein [Ardenticatenaceae bacterium]
MKFIACGGLRIDFLITAEREVRLRQIGGNSIYSALGARVWIDEVALLAKAGENYPEEWLAELASRGLTTEGLVRVPGWQEMRTFYAYVDARTRVDRDPASHFARVGHPLPPELEGYVNSTLGQQDLSGANPMTLLAADIPAFAAQSDAAHIAPMGPYSQCDLAQGFKRLGVPQITVDPGEFRPTPENIALVRGLCAAADAFLPSELEVALLFEQPDLHAAAEALASWGPALILIKRGPQGCLLYERDAHRFTAIPAYPARIVDVTGAGDSFCGGFAVGLRQSADPVRAALMGSVSASFAIEGYGALYALGASRHAANERLQRLGRTVRQL